MRPIYYVELRKLESSRLRRANLIDWLIVAVALIATVACFVWS